MKNLEEWLKSTIDSCNKKIDSAVTQGFNDAKIRQEGFLEALYSIQDFLQKGIKDEDLNN